MSSLSPETREAFWQEAAKTVGEPTAPLDLVLPQPTETDQVKSQGIIDASWATDAGDPATDIRQLADHIRANHAAKEERYRRTLADIDAQLSVLSPKQLRIMGAFIRGKIDVLRPVAGDVICYQIPDTMYVDEDSRQIMVDVFAEMLKRFPDSVTGLLLSDTHSIEIVPEATMNAAGWFRCEPDAVKEGEK
jgi:hypothetical protein